MASLRVVSVLPSATEIVSALGHGGDLVGRSEDCDFPRGVRELPVVMRARDRDVHSPSSEIDARVHAARARGESLYELDIDLLRELAPDLLLTQDLCGVCSVTGSEVEEACDRAGVHPSVISLTPRTLGEVWASVERVAEALGDRAAGERLAERLRLRSRRERASPAPRVAVIEWLDPPFLAGLWVPEMIRASGGVAVGPVAGRPGESTRWPAVEDSRPDLVVLSPCSFGVDRTEREAREPPLARALSDLAPRLGTFLADEAYFSRPGPRLADGVDLLRHLRAGDVWDPPMPVRPFRDLEVSA